MYLFTLATIQQAKQKAAISAWAQAGWQKIEEKATLFLDQKQTIPDEAGGWIHNYICLEHWLPLIFDGDTPGNHRCPAGHLCTGEKYDAAWRVWRHRELTDLARDAGLAFQVMGSEAGRKTALAILFQYADFYTRFDGLSDAEPWMLKGHAFNQALTEGLWAMPLIQAYDCVASELTSEQKARFRKDLWTPLQAVMEQAQDKLIAQEHTRSNYLAWINGALGLMGFTLQNQAMIDRAIEAPAGYKAHLDVAISADNLEFEVTPYYHNFVVLGNLNLAEAALANGIDLYNHIGAEGQSMLGMGKAFADLAWPDGTLLDISEGSYWQNSVYDKEIYQAYEILYGLSQESGFAHVLKAAYERDTKPRDNWAALLFGRPEIAQPRPISDWHVSEATNTFMEHAGLAQWRSKNKLAAMVTFGPYTGHHHQYDRLSLNVWPFSKDAGSPLYALAARKSWYLHSHAHNTLVVDGLTHAKCGGELKSWDGNRLIVKAPEAYPGVDFERTTEMLDEKIVDVLMVQAEDEHTFDWLFHIDGDLVLPSNIHAMDQPLQADGPGAFIQLNATQAIKNSVEISICHEGIDYQLTLSGDVPFTLFIGTSPGTSRTPMQPRHVLIGRTIGQKQTYSTVIEQK
jgi:hypothetical protein